MRLYINLELKISQEIFEELTNCFLVFRWTCAIFCCILCATKTRRCKNAENHKKCHTMQKCGEIIESKHLHDFIRYKFGDCTVDGGHCYLRRSLNSNNVLSSIFANRCIFSSSGDFSIIDQMLSLDNTVYDKPSVSLSWNGKVFYPRN